ncbi:DNA/RNA non-specific endonuclease [Xylanibacter muris]|uniref:Endonuclease n=1 Tax=Xylanibacter muris TaxID=2736290 RepID=A0ABX2ARB5_9BACT|nr:DNA/RNA non-specific endonuclease [Xylanibacter muris]NPD92787.1 DNA/RNA non-specific endonuclease [Xylanibacter muris]
MTNKLKGIAGILAAAVCLITGSTLKNPQTTNTENINRSVKNEYTGIDTGSTEKSIRQKKTTRHRKPEMPAAIKGVLERVIEHKGYTVSFNREHNNPNYVAWELTASETEGTVKRYDDFTPDPDIPAPHQVNTDDYKGCGYDRGHMAPAADMKWSRQAMKECFYMSNICPQNHSLNAGGWKTLEEACRRWARQEGRIYIVCGPVYRKGKKQKTIGKEHIITVPDGFFKVIMSLRKGNEKAIGFYYTNKNGSQRMAEKAMSVDDIEKMTGINFFVNVDNKTERRIEAVYSLKAWR